MGHKTKTTRPRVLLAGDHCTGVSGITSHFAPTDDGAEPGELRLEKAPVNRADLRAAVGRERKAGDPYCGVCLCLDEGFDDDAGNVARALWTADPDLEILFISQEKESFDVAAMSENMNPAKWAIVQCSDLLGVHQWALAAHARRIAHDASHLRLENEKEHRAALEDELSDHRKQHLNLEDMVSGVSLGLGTPVRSIDEGIASLGDAFYNLLTLLDAYDELEREVRSAPGLESRRAVIEEARLDVDVEALMEEVPTALLGVSDGLQTMTAITHSLGVISGQKPNNSQAA